MGNMRFKVGDRVRIKSLGWYDENKDVYGYIECGKSSMNFETSQLCGKIVTISRINDATNTYRIEEDNGFYNWTDEMIECKVDEEMKSEDRLLDDYEELTDRAFKGRYEKCKSDIELNGFQLPEGYIFKDEYGNMIVTSKIILEKKKKEYPKTYAECCEIIHSDPNFYVDTHLYSGILETLYKLLICRDAYWKIAGEEMGLGKPWEPDWKNDEQFKYIIICRRGCIIKDTYTAKDVILAFPTEEMRDAFFENFKELIEQCKELL